MLDEEKTFNEAPKMKKYRDHLYSIWDILRFAIIVFAIIVPIRVFVAQPFIVSGSSMSPTFETGEYLIVDQLSYQFHDPERGDVVIFKYPNDPSKYFIKRIIGLPNETIKIEGDIITITNKDHPNGIVLVEDYLTFFGNNTMTTTLSEDEFFVMGDNRGASLDSRSWGPLSKEFLTGKAFLRVIPSPTYKPGGVELDF
jgi:signal peptidase I